MSSIKETISIFTDSSGTTPQSSSFQRFILFNPDITTTLVVNVPHYGPHSQTKPTIPKHRQRKGTKVLAAKKKKKIPIVIIIDLTGDGI